MKICHILIIWCTRSIFLIVLILNIYAHAHNTHNISSEIIRDPRLLAKRRLFRNISLKKTTIDLGKLAYNLGKAEVVRRFVYHILQRDISRAQHAGFFTCETLELASMIAGTLALIESIYDSYAETLHEILYPSDDAMAMHNSTTSNIQNSLAITPAPAPVFMPTMPTVAPMVTPIAIPVVSVTPTSSSSSSTHIQYTYSYSVVKPKKEHMSS